MEYQAFCFSPFFSLLFHAVILSMFCVSISEYALATIPGNETDKLALLDFKSRITDDPDGVLESWNSTVHLCLWTGVTCGLKHQRVTAFDLKGQRLAGTISPLIGNLSFLRVLDLSDNSFHGEMPLELGHLIRLQTLNLSFNSLSGEIPNMLSRCADLIDLIVDHNFLHGHIPPEIGSLTNLEMLYLKNNNLTGNIPASIGNLTSLVELYLSYNDLEGEVPETMAKLSSLTMLGISVNRLTGAFPPAFYNLTSLRLIGLAFNNFRGTLRPDLGLKFPNLQMLYLANNYFTGSIPASLANATKLLRIDLPLNNFTGNVPPDLGNLQNLFWFNVLTNNLGYGTADDLSFISSLTNCQNLEFLDIADNNFGGILPKSLTNLSTTMTRLLVGQNGIYGSIPEDISNLENLNVLSIKETFINGSIPDSVGRLSNLKNLHLESNLLSGRIPSTLGSIKGLLYLFLQDNSLEGYIPPTLGNFINILRVDLSQNRLSGSVPKQLVSLSSLSILLNLSHNYLTGPLPDEVGNLTNLAALDVSNNNLSGNIPSSLGNCLSLETLLLQGNSFEGMIPSLSDLEVIQYIDLSSNNLSGHIPQNLANHPSLRNLNLSLNSLEGEVPILGVFADASSIQLFGNPRLCGGIEELHLQPCLMQPLENDQKHHALKITLVIVAVASCFVLMSILLLFCWTKRNKSKAGTVTSFGDIWRKVSYEDLLHATGGFASHNMIGSGNFGTVYRGALGPNATVVAVKVLKLHQKGAFKSFLAECKVLRNIRHRNLVKVLTACSSLDFQGNDFKALVYQFMPNGSLEDWLHPNESQLQQRNLNIFQRVNIAIDVASAMHYLHNLCDIPVVHCDLKPSNVLLDNDLSAHVGDFGLARLLKDTTNNAESHQFSSLGMKGTIGYAAPEYGMGGQVSTQGDVYSYGILLLEIFTGRRPTDQYFNDIKNLRNFVDSALPDQVLDIVDGSAFLEETLLDEVDSPGLKSKSRVDLSACLITVLKIGLACSVEAPHSRIGMGQVVTDLLSIRNEMRTLLLNTEAEYTEESMVYF